MLQTYKTRGIVISQGFGISKSFQGWVRLNDLILQGSLEIKVEILLRHLQATDSAVSSSSAKHSLTEGSLCSKVIYSALPQGRHSVSGRTVRPSINYESLKGLEHSAAPYCLALQVYILCHLHEKEITSVLGSMWGHPRKEECVQERGY